MKVLLDTCVIIDSLQNREPFSECSNQILFAAANCRFSGCIASKALADIYYLMHRHIHDNRKVREILSILLEIFDLLDTTAADCKKAIVSETSDFEDAIMLETAIREHVDCIVTRNLKDYVNTSVPILSPEAFLKKLNLSGLTDSFS